ncbi:MAG: hypothetical protein ACOC6H_04365 [Thermoproteota archaeon]
MAKSISKTVQTIIDNDLPLQDALRKGYGNYSAIARMLRERVNDKLDQEVKLESIITAVKRASVPATSHREDITKVVAESIINIRTDVTKISVEKTKRNLEKIRTTVSNLSEEFFHMIEGVSAVTLIFDQKILDKVESNFQTEILDKRKKLAAVIIRSPTNMVTTPGCLLTFVNAISRRDINIEETMSCFTDTIFLLAMDDVSKAFSALTDLIGGARKRMASKA